ncbi:MAG: hypothetical protein LBJ08_05340, partial [Bifidobacteriaceae bacterium]|nr:hypothetical protein [Bifidobacteriaceae bacterium]
VPVEIKSSTTFSRSFLKGISKWHRLDSGSSPGFLVYGGPKGEVGDVRLVALSVLAPLID